MVKTNLARDLRRAGRKLLSLLSELCVPADTSETIPFLAYRRTGKETSDNEIVVESIREDVRFLRQHPLIKDSTRITGGFYNLATGLVEDVEY